MSFASFTGQTKHIGLNDVVGRVTSLLGKKTSLGSLGGVVFQTSTDKILTFSNFTRTKTANFAEHEVYDRKPVSEFTGSGLDVIDFTIVLNASAGVNPLAELRKLEKIIESGEPQTLTIGAKNFGKVTLRSLTDPWEYITNRGEPLLITAELNLVEYVSNVQTQGFSKLVEDMIKRGTTGKGGPVRLSSTPPFQERKLTVKK